MTSLENIAAAPVSNIPEYSVAEITGAVRTTLEQRFARIRVRGEVSGFKRHSSGHLYFDLKDAEAVLAAVCWRGTAVRLPLVPDDGMEVICTGRITGYGRTSRYQMVVEDIAIAGEGALLKMIEDRRKRLAAEGLFDVARKRPIPYLPEVIGVITSPSGAVIRDILHRLGERFPRRVIVWPVAVQGEGSAQQVATAIAGFNALSSEGAVPRPDLIIVARGGGSLEDLMAFNDEGVVRAAAASRIPLISAVGHETDTTLIDFASDLRCPTPTAAAEKAVPVRAELLADLLRDERRLVSALRRLVDERRTRVAGLARGLGDPRRLIEDAQQRLDDRGERLKLAFDNRLAALRGSIAELGARLPHPKQQHRQAAIRIADMTARLFAARRQIERALRDGQARVAECEVRGRGAVLRAVSERRQALSAHGKLLEASSYERVLERGFVLVEDLESGAPVTAAADLPAGETVTLHFHDGRVQALVAESAALRRVRRSRAQVDPTKQGSLL